MQVRERYRERQKNSDAWVDYNMLEVLCNNFGGCVIFLRMECVLIEPHGCAELYKRHQQRSDIFRQILLVYFGYSLILGCNIHTHTHVSVPLKVTRIFEKSLYLSPSSIEHWYHIALVTGCGEHLCRRCFVVYLQWCWLFCKRSLLQITKLALSINMIKFRNNHENKIFSRS